jgi:phosphatidylglycerophosphate synthase/flavodoxin
MGLYLLKFHSRKLLEPVARKMGFVHPDVLSYAATVITVGTAFCYYYAITCPILLLLSIALTLLRMTLNMLDGVLAIQRGETRLMGEVVNALPDRYSDIIFVAGIALSPLCRPVYGLLGLCSMFVVSYSGMLGKAVGASWQHHGPLGKVERLIIVMIFSLVQYLRLRSGTAGLVLLGVELTPMEWCMATYLILGQVTVYNRLRGMMREITRSEWQSRERYRQLSKKVLVVYDSQTGNTEKIAYETAECLKADIRKAGEVEDVGAYDLLVIATPNIRGEPTKKIKDFVQARSGVGSYAVIVTYGLPIWGRISTAMCFSWFEKALGSKPIARFSSKGYHAKYKTYKGRPNETDLLRAFLFGVRIAQRLEALE